MPRPPLQIDFDHHRHEAQRLRRQAIDMEPGQDYV